jgi:integrase
MIYHVYQPTLYGQKRWGYYYRMDGKRKTIVKDPRTKKPFASQEDVESWIRELREEESSAPIKVREIAEHLFDVDGEWAKRQARRRDGRPLAPQTIYEHGMIVRKHIIPKLGDEAVVDVTADMIEDFLYSLEISNRTRQNVATTFLAVLRQAQRKRIIKSVPLIEMPQKKSRKPNIFTLEDLRKLFPRDRAALQEVWAPGKTGWGEPPEARLAIAACAATMFFGGLRPQEARAVGPEQLHRDSGILLVTRSFDGQGKVNQYAKMGDANDPRYRGTLLIDWALEVMDPWLQARRREDFLFTYREGYIRKDLLLDRLRLAIKTAGIPTEGKRFIPYSGRYTFDTTVKPFLPAAVLMALMGHVDPAMPERYDVPILLERMRQLAPYRQEINRAVEGELIPTEQVRD